MSRWYPTADRAFYIAATGLETEYTLTAEGRDFLSQSTVAAQQTAIGLGTDDSPTFAGLNIPGSVLADTVLRYTPFTFFT